MNPTSNKALKCELLAPAGNPEMLHAAIDAGADAAYLGLHAFNARRNAKNFDLDTFSDACRYAHLRGARLYVAMNTIVFDEELKSAIDLAKRAYDAGADAFIIQDLGLAKALADSIEGVRLHASTQMSIHSASGLQMASELGFARATLAREMSLDEIRFLCEAGRRADIQIETFAHGALCISYSGQCLMSSMIGCRSANRGLCAQPCRLSYELIDRRDPSKSAKAQGEHLLSPKDLCAIDDINALVDMGVSSLKIEGRMKSPEYAHTVVEVYRRRLDEALDRDSELAANGKGSGGDAANVGRHDFNVRDRRSQDRDKLESVFSRGFSDSYLSGTRDNSMMSYQRPNNRGQFVGRVKSASKGKVEVSLDRPLVEGDVCEIWTRRGNMIVEVGSDANIAPSKFIFDIDDAKSRKGDRDSFVPIPSKGDRVFRVRSADAQVDISQNDPKIEICGKAIARIGEPFTVELSVAQTKNSVNRRLNELVQVLDVQGFAEGPEVEPARTKAISEEEIVEHVGRMGATPFALCGLDVELDEGVGMSFSQIHRVRAQALEDLGERILTALGYSSETAEAAKSKSALNTSVSSRPQAAASSDARPQPDTIGTRTSAARTQADLSDPKICVLVSNPDCARAAKRNGAHAIYVDALNYRRSTSQMEGRAIYDTSQAGYPKHCTLLMGPISHDEEGYSREAMLEMDAWSLVKEGADVAVSSIDGIYQALSKSCNMEIGPQLPVVNKSSVELMSRLGAQAIWLSSELSLAQIEELCEPYANDSSAPPFGVMVLGAQELMLCEHCTLMSLGDCDQDCLACARRQVPFALRDKMGYEFPIVTDCLGRSHIYNSLPTDNVNAVEKLLDANVQIFMINAQLMDPEQTAQATARLRGALEKALAGQGPVEKQKSTTTAHFYRPVE